MISVLILTKNEEKDLPGCLESVSWCDDIHVLDSFSTDATTKLAENAGAHLTYREFDYFSAHQNWALQNIAFKYPWVLYIDADERVTDALLSSMQAAVQNPDENIAFRIQRRDFYEGRWLKHVQASPYYLRLFRPQKMKYSRMGHPVSLPDGEVAFITGYLDHYPFSKGLHHWIDRHNRYSTEEALQIAMTRSQNVTFSFRDVFFNSDFHQRRYHQKELFYRLPMRPWIKFLLLYVLKRGFLDGKAGLTYATLQAIYEYMIVLKTKELKKSAITKPKLTTLNEVRSPAEKGDCG